MSERAGYYKTLLGVLVSFRCAHGQLLVRQHPELSIAEAWPNCALSTTLQCHCKRQIVYLLCMILLQSPYIQTTLRLVTKPSPGALVQPANLTVPVQLVHF